MRCCVLTHGTCGYCKDEGILNGCSLCDKSYIPKNHERPTAAQHMGRGEETEARRQQRSAAPPPTQTRGVTIQEVTASGSGNGGQPPNNGQGNERPPSPSPPPPPSPRLETADLPEELKAVAMALWLAIRDSRPHPIQD